MPNKFFTSHRASRSGSMTGTDRGPLANSPMTQQIMRRANNRLGAIYSALYSFWSARHAAVTAGQQIVGARRDAYSIVLFNERAATILALQLFSRCNYSRQQLRELSRRTLRSRAAPTQLLVARVFRKPSELVRKS